MISSHLHQAQPFKQPIVKWAFFNKVDNLYNLIQNTSETVWDTFVSEWRNYSKQCH